MSHHMYRSKLLLIILTLIALLCESCTPTLSDSRPEGRVIERSKQTKPLWAASPPDQLVVNATEAKIHYVKTRERDLPIAVKTSQTKAIESSFVLWKPSFDERMREFPQIMAAKTARNEIEFSSLMDQAAHKVHTQAAQIEDIYYERIRIDHPEKVPELEGVSEYFDVHVLVQLLPVESGKIQSVLHQVFKTAKSPDLVRAAKQLAPKSNTGLSREKK